MSRLLLRFLTLPCLALALLLGAVAESDAQTLVYRFQIQQEKSGINLESFDSAYFVVNGLGGQGTFIFTYREDGRDFYLASAGSGTLFFAVRPGEDKAVVRATAQSGGAQSHYLALGDLDGRVSSTFRGQKVSLGVAKTLNGWVLASDPEEDAPVTDLAPSVGMAGFATLRGHLDERLTRDSNRGNQDVAATVESVIERLERDGYEDGEPEESAPAEVTTGEVR